MTCQLQQLLLDQAWAEVGWQIGVVNNAQAMPSRGNTPMMVTISHSGGADRAEQFAQVDFVVARHGALVDGRGNIRIARMEVRDGVPSC